MKRDLLKTPTTFMAMELKFQYKSLPILAKTLNISTAREAYEFLEPIFEPFIESYECFYVLYLNRRNKIVGYTKISQGSTCGTTADPGFIILHALKLNSRNIILSHNHPSGNAQPSAQDIALTKKIKEAADLYGIFVLDHLIMLEGGFYSFANEGML